MTTDLTYCEKCLKNYDDDGFDYRFDQPICLDCGSEYPMCNNCEDPMDPDSNSDICQSCEDKAIYWGVQR